MVGLTAFSHMVVVGRRPSTTVTICDILCVQVSTAHGLHSGAESSEAQNGSVLQVAGESGDGRPASPGASGMVARKYKVTTAPPHLVPLVRWPRSTK